MQQQLLHLESEIARLQIELRQVRQLIGSLIRTEQTTQQMVRNQQAMGGQQMPPQYLQEELQAPQQFQRMRQVADRMDGQLQQMAQSFQPNTTVYRGHVMNPTYNDPVQRQY